LPLDICLTPLVAVLYDSFGGYADAHEPAR